MNCAKPVQVRGNAHGGEAAGGADSGGREAGIRMGGLARGPAQQKFEELLFDGGLEAADGGDRRGAQGAGEVVAFEDEVAGAVDGAEEGDGFAVEEGGVADEGDGRRRRRGRCKGVGMGGCRARWDCSE